jgi:hypothetical protein
VFFLKVRRPCVVVEKNVLHLFVSSDEMIHVDIYDTPLYVEDCQRMEHKQGVNHATKDMHV